MELHWKLKGEREFIFIKSNLWSLEKLLVLLTRDDARDAFMPTYSPKSEKGPVGLTQQGARENILCF